MSAEQTTTERKVSDLQVGDALVLSSGASFLAALIVDVKPAAYGTKTDLTFLVVPAGETKVVESGGIIDSDYTVEVMA